MTKSTQTRLHENTHADRKVKIRCMQKTHRAAKNRQVRVVERVARNMTSYVNIHGDFVREATATLQGEDVKIISYGISSAPWSVDRS